MKLYIAVFDEVPDNMVPLVVAHAVLGAHMEFQRSYIYQDWLKESFKKCIIRVNRKEFAKISVLPNAYLSHESTILAGTDICAVPPPYDTTNLPNVLKFAKLWKPKEQNNG